MNSEFTESEAEEAAPGRLSASAMPFKHGPEIAFRI